MREKIKKTMHLSWSFVHASWILMILLHSPQNLASMESHKQENNVFITIVLFSILLSHIVVSDNVTHKDMNLYDIWNNNLPLFMN